MGESVLVDKEVNVHGIWEEAKEKEGLGDDVERMHAEGFLGVC